MDADDFWPRLVSRASARYGIALTRRKFESWIEEYIVPPAEKAGAHIWRRDCYAYRRALEASRIESRAPNDRRLMAREIRLQMYLSGGRFPGVVIGEDLYNEFTRSKRELLRTLRSSLSAVGAGELDPKRVPTIRRQMGEEAPQILPAGFRYKDSELIPLLSLFLTGDSAAVIVGEDKILPADALESIVERWGLSQLLTKFMPDFIEIAIGVLAGLVGDTADFGERDPDADIAAAGEQALTWISQTEEVHRG